MWYIGQIGQEILDTVIATLSAIAEEIREEPQE